MLNWLLGTKCPYCGSRKTEKCSGYEAQKYQDEQFSKKYGSILGRISGTATGVPHGGTIGSLLGRFSYLLPGSKTQEWVLGKISDGISGQSYICKSCRKIFTESK